MKRVLLVEDHVAFRQALATLIDQLPSFRIVAQAGSLAEGLKKAYEGFDLAIVDLSVPDGDGVDLVAGLRAVNPRAGVLGLSRRSRRERYARALEAGANEVISKNATIEEILGALEPLSNGKTSIFTWDQCPSPSGKSDQDNGPRSPGGHGDRPISPAGDAPAHGPIPIKQGVEGLRHEHTNGRRE